MQKALAARYLGRLGLLGRGRGRNRIVDDIKWSWVVVLEAIEGHILSRTGRVVIITMPEDERPGDRHRSAGDRFQAACGQRKQRTKT